MRLLTSLFVFLSIPTAVLSCIPGDPHFGCPDERDTDTIDVTLSPTTSPSPTGSPTLSASPTISPTVASNAPSVTEDVVGGGGGGGGGSQTPAPTLQFDPVIRGAGGGDGLSGGVIAGIAVGALVAVAAGGYLVASTRNASPVA